MSPAQSMARTGEVNPGLSPRHVWMLLTVLVAGMGFAYKFVEFSKTWVEGELLGFAVVPLLIYVLISAGFACLLAWSVLGGQFQGVEEPKYTLIERELLGDDPAPLPYDGSAITVLGRVVAALAQSFILLSLTYLAWVVLSL